MKNSSLSYRAFAKRVGLSPTTLTLALKGKRKISLKLAEQIARRLHLDPQERSQLFKSPLKEVASEDHQDQVQLTTDQFQVIADWRSFAILGLLEIPGFKLDYTWMAQRLACSETIARQTVERLFRLGMIITKADGEICRATPRYRTSDDVLNLSLQKSHLQTLEIARNSCLNDAVSLRDLTWLTLPIDIKDLPKAKELIRNFQESFGQLMKKSSTPTEVYRLAIQLFPLTKSIAEEN